MINLLDRAMLIGAVRLKLFKFSGGKSALTQGRELGELSSRSFACKLKDVLRGNKHVIESKALRLPWVFNGRLSNDGYMLKPNN